MTRFPSETYEKERDRLPLAPEFDSRLGALCSCRCATSIHPASLVCATAISVESGKTALSIGDGSSTPAIPSPALLCGSTLRQID